MRRVTYIRFSVGRSSNGKTADSGSAYRGSNPCLPAKESAGASDILLKEKNLSAWRKTGAAAPPIITTRCRIAAASWSHHFQHQLGFVAYRFVEQLPKRKFIQSRLASL